MARVSATAIALPVAAILIATSASPSRASDGPLAVHADLLWPASGPPIEQATVLIQGGRIAAVGATGNVTIPDGATEMRAAVVTPGFIDAYSSVGLAGTENVAAVLDQDEHADPDQADLRTIDAFHPREPLLRHLLEHGVTLVQTGPGPVAPIAGQAGIFRTDGRSADAMAVRFPSAMVFNLGEIPKGVRRGRSEAPATRMGTAAFIRRRLAKAKEYADAVAKGADWVWQKPEYDTKLAALGPVVAGELPVLFTAHRSDDILTALRIMQEFGLRGSIGGATEAYLVAEELREAKATLLAGPVMERVSTPERRNASYENPAILHRNQIPFALRSGFEGYVPRNRVILFEAGVAVANGLPEQAALRAITLDAARLLGIDLLYGSIATGKVADLVLFDGDPFEYTTHVEAVVSNGVVVHRR